MKKVIIIGAGIGGLATAIRLAVKGYSVEVYESNTYPGGKLTELQLGDFRFDAGPSLFTMPQLVDELYTLAGKKPKQHFEYEQLDEVCHYFYEDGTMLVAYADKQKFANEVQQKLGVPASRVMKHLQKSAFIYDSTAYLFLERSLHRIKSYLSFRVLWSLMKLPFMNLFKTMHDANASAMKEERMTQLFDRYATYNGSNPYQAPGILNIIPHLEFGQGAFFPKGGMHTITKSIYQLAQDLGVNFYFGQKVTKILVKDKQTTGIKINEKELSADLVVCNMDVVPAYKYLMAEQAQPTKILQQERSSSALIFYWGVKGNYKDLDVHNIFFSADYKSEFESIFEQKTIGNDPTVYVNITSKKEKSDAPSDHENWFVMINVPGNTGQDWDHLIKKAKKDIIVKLNRMMNIDLEKLIVEEQILDPRTIESKTQSYQGSLYGTASNEQMAAFFRHPNFSNKIGNLYFCGGSVHPGGGIPLALSSAKIVDDLIKKA